MREQEEITIYQAIANYFEIDEADVVDNCDNETVTVFDQLYQIIDLEEPIRMNDVTYYWAIVEIHP